MKKTLAIIIMVSMLAIGFASCNDSTDDPGKKPAITLGGNDHTDVEDSTTKPEEVVTTEPDKSADEIEFKAVDDIVIVTVDTVNIRTNTIKNDDTVYTLRDKGDELKRTAVSKNWSKIEIEGASYYVSNSCIRIKDDFTALEENLTKYANKTLTVRIDPDAESEAIDWLKEGQKVVVIGTKEGTVWVKIENKDYGYAFVNSRYLRDTEKAPSTEETTTKTQPQG